MALMATRNTGEGRLIRSVLLVNHAAARASKARVPGIDKNDGDAAHLCLVGNECAQLPKRPVMQAGSLTARGRNPAADVLEVFEHDAASGAFGSRDERLRDAMVDVTLEPSLTARQGFEPPFRSLGASFLQSRSAASKLGPDLLDGLARVGVAVAVCRQMGDTEIDAEPILGIESFGFGDIAGCGEHPLAAHEAQIDLTLSESHQLSLMLAHDDGHGDPPFDRPQGHGVAAIDEPQDAIVVGLGCELSEDRRGLAVNLEGISHLGDRTHGSLSRKTEFSAGLFVERFVQVELTEPACLETFRRQPRASGVAPLKGVLERLRLLLRRKELHRSNQLHASNIEGTKQEHKGRRFLCLLPQAVSAPEIR